MVSVDIYVNETTRHADVILPGPSPLERSHYDLALLAASRCATWPTTRRRSLAARARRAGRVGDAAAPDRRSSPGRGRTPTSPRSTTSSRSRPRAARRRTPSSPVARPRSRRSCWPRSRRASGPSGSLDLHAARRALRRARRSADLEAAPARHRPRAARAAHARGPAHAAAARSSSRPRRSSPTSRACTRRWREPATATMVLVGRRDLRSNNSWMHNLPSAGAAASSAAPLHVHPDDAERLGLVDGEPAVVRSRAGDDRGARRGDRRRDARRRLDPARLGPRPRRASSSRVAARARRGELQRARRRARARAAVGQRGAQRDPGRARRRV